MRLEVQISLRPQKMFIIMVFLVELVKASTLIHEVGGSNLPKTTKKVYNLKGSNLPKYKLTLSEGYFGKIM